MGHRAGQPSRVPFNGAGDRVLMLNRGSEDVFLYEVDGTNGSAMTLRAVFPPRIDFQERAALDTSTPMGDLPLGMAIADDPTTANDDALVYVINEVTRTLSVLRVDWDGNVIFQETTADPDAPGPRQVQPFGAHGQRALRGRLARPDHRRRRSTTPAARATSRAARTATSGSVPTARAARCPCTAATIATGLVLWKGVRLNLGETGPMFGGENGGTGIFTDAEQQALIDYHETIAVAAQPEPREP